MKRRVVEKKLVRWGEMKGGQTQTYVRYVVEEFTEHDGCWHVMKYRRSVNGDEVPADFGNPDAAIAFMRGEWGVVQETIVDESVYEDYAEKIHQGLPQGGMRMPD